MNEIILNKWFDVNNTKYKVHSIKLNRDGKHFDVIIYKDLSYLKLKNKYAQLEIYYSEHENDYVVAWVGYDHGFTHELLEFCTKVIHNLKENPFKKVDGLESVNI